MSGLLNQILLEENARLREELGLSQETKGILAAVLSRPPALPFDIFLLEAGKDRGVSPGDLVYSGSHILLGKIIETSAHTAKAFLFSSVGEILEGVVERSQASVTLKGRGGGDFEVELPRGFDIEKGDLIIKNGSNVALIAEVGGIATSSGGSIEKVLLASPINIQTLRFVRIVKID